MVRLRVYRSDEPGPGENEVPDDELCDALAAGQPWAAVALYDRVEETVETVLFRMLGPGDLERDDLMQQALERLISTVVLGKFERRCSLKSWAALVTQNLVLSALRARARERRVLDRSITPQMLELVAVPGETPERAAEVQRRLETVQSALAGCKADRAEALVLHDLLGYELTEIARLTGVSVAAAQSRLVRGRRDVASRIERDERRRQGGRRA